MPSEATEGSKNAGMGSPGQPRKPQYPIESVDNALRILLFLGEKRSLRLTEVSEYLSVASSTAHRVLAMLQYRGFVRQSSTSRAYEPGPALTEIAFSVLRHTDVREQIRPDLERLCQKHGETVMFSRLDGTMVSFIDAIESDKAVRVASRMGKSLPAHCSASGKALLSLLGDDAIKSLIPNEDLERLTPHTIQTRTALLEELERTRARGYATGQQESEDGVISVAIPLGTRVGARFAVSISAPSHRSDSFNEADVARDLTELSQKAKSSFLL